LNKKIKTNKPVKLARKEWVGKQKILEISNDEEEVHKDNVVEKENQETINLASKEAVPDNLNADQINTIAGSKNMNNLNDLDVVL